MSNLGTIQHRYTLQVYTIRLIAVKCCVIYKAIYICYINIPDSYSNIIRWYGLLPVQHLDVWIQSILCTVKSIHVQYSG